METIDHVVNRDRILVDNAGYFQLVETRIYVLVFHDPSNAIVNNVKNIEKTKEEVN